MRIEQLVLKHLINNEDYARKTIPFIEKEYFSDSTLTSSDVLAGPAGYRLRLLVGASTNLNSSTYLFTQLGSTSTIGSTNLFHIDTTIRVTGATTGFRVDIPIRFLKQQ